MDLFFLLAVYVLGIVFCADFITEGKVKKALTVPAVVIVITVFVFGTAYMFTTTTTTTKYDVVQYDDIVYSSPKTVIETKTKGPFWSVLWDSKTYKVKDELIQ